MWGKAAAAGPGLHTRGPVDLAERERVFLAVQAAGAHMEARGSLVPLMAAVEVTVHPLRLGRLPVA